jgi:uncharacterized protein with HEPN domain
VKRSLPFLKHILEEINFLLKETRGLDFDDFVSNELLKRSCTRSIEIIGEATKNLSPETKKKYKGVDWKRMAGMRDKIIHYYFGVNWDIVWSVIQDNVPELKGKIEKIIEDLEASE